MISDSRATFDSFGASALNIQVFYLVADIEFLSYLKIKEEVNFKIIAIVEQYGSGFAYPTQRTIGEHTVVDESESLKSKA